MQFHMLQAEESVSEVKEHANTTTTKQLKGKDEEIYLEK